MTEGGNEGQSPASPRTWDEMMADAITILTEAARSRRPVWERTDDGQLQPHPVRTEPADWAEFVTLAVAGAVANVGSVGKALEGRSGSWEAESVRSMLLSTAGEDPSQLLTHRTEPLRVVLRPAEILTDLGYDAVYDESERVVARQQEQCLWRYQFTHDRTWEALDDGAPTYNPGADWSPDPGARMDVPRSVQDEQEYDRLYELESQLEDLRYVQDPRAYGEVLRAAVVAQAGERFPGIDVEVEVDLDERRFPEFSDYDTPEDELIEAARLVTPLPWSGIAPKDYPLDRAALVDVERNANRLPHQRLATQPVDPEVDQ